MDFERSRRPSHELNLIPLIDIVFHLLVFVMLTTTFVVSESMELSLPASRASAPVPGVTRIQINRDGALYVNQTLTDRNGLNGYLVELLARDPESKIAIFTTPGVSVQQLVTVMDDVYLTGGRNVQVDKFDTLPGGA